MSNIQHALGRLFERLEYLETAAQEQEKRLLHARQQDLFSRAANGNKHTGVDARILARKLDVAIEKVEQVLREG